ncbi:MAG: hypothetical protein WCZ23_03435 [Rhodospirillaceae bacterium]
MTLRHALLILVMMIVGLGPAAAYDEQARRYATSSAPYWKIGTLDQELSRLCQQGRFNQKRISELYIAFIGKEGKGITGVAKVGYNLHDPIKKGDREKTYHFFSDATTDCRVYVAP